MVSYYTRIGVFFSGVNCGRMSVSPAEDPAATNASDFTSLVTDSPACKAAWAPRCEGYE